MWKTFARCRELRELSDRLTNDGRDALAALQMELEADEEARLAEERGRLRDTLACERRYRPGFGSTPCFVLFFVSLLQNRYEVYSRLFFRLQGISEPRTAVGWRWRWQRWWWCWWWW